MLSEQAMVHPSKITKEYIRPLPAYWGHTSIYKKLFWNIKR